MAASVLEAIRAKIARGTPPQAAVDEWAPVSSERNSIGHWVCEYVARQEERCQAGALSPNTLTELRRCARTELAWWDGRSLTEVDALTIDEWSRWLSRERGLAPKTVRNALGNFRAFLRWLARMERIERVPEFPSIRVPDYTPTIISQRTQALILAQIPHDRRGVFLALCHGTRPGEARALDLVDVQDREDVPGLLIRRAVKGQRADSPILGTKTGDASWIPMTDELAEWIAWRRTQKTGPWASPALFPNPVARPRRNPEFRHTHGSLEDAWRAACVAVGVEVSLYEGTKHSSATAWRSGGMSLELVRRMLRHRDARSTERYGKLADGALVEAFRRRNPKR